MTRILDFSETVGCGATFMLDSGEPCVLSVAQTGVRVRKSRYGFMGPILYDERNAQTGIALDAILPARKFPCPYPIPSYALLRMRFGTAPMRADVARTLNEAFSDIGEC
jgi:hypothetical protein